MAAVPKEPSGPHSRDRGAIAEAAGAAAGRRCFCAGELYFAGRPHVARALIQRKVCASLDEAFERFLKKNRPGWVPKEKITAQEALALIHEAGGLGSGGTSGTGGTEEALPELIEAGMDGIECFHTRHSPSASEYYVSLAEKHELVITGGSDCHGMNKGKPLIGSIEPPISMCGS